MLTWRDGGDRIVAVCGELTVGFVFQSKNEFGPQKFRWRLIYAAGGMPMEVRAKGVDEAKETLAKHFNLFLYKARLTPIIPDAEVQQ